MEELGRDMEGLRQQVLKKEAELEDLKRKLAEAESAQQSHGQKGSSQPLAWKWPLRAEEYERYSRQLVLPGVGVAGQYIGYPHC